MMMNKKGFTAVEMIIGTLLVSILTVAMVSAQLNIGKEQLTLSRFLDSEMDRTIAERILFNDFANIDPSYNNLKLLDDSGRGFFDYYPDIPANALGTELGREIVLSLKGRRDVVFLIREVSAGALLNYDPTAAYAIGAVPADFNTSASLSFVSLNQGNWISSQRPGFWVEGRALLLDTPARLRPVSAGGGVDMKIAPRSPIFVGQVNGAALTVNPELKDLLVTTNPRTSVEITSADAFLRGAPSIGGGQTLIRVRAIKLVKYSLQEYEGSAGSKGTARLFRSYSDGTTWTTPAMITDNLIEVSFKRESVLRRTVYYELKKADEKVQASLAQ